MVAVTYTITVPEVCPGPGVRSTTFLWTEEHAAISEGLVDAVDWPTSGRGPEDKNAVETDLYMRYMAHWHSETSSNALYVRHKGLLLDYEEAMTRRYPIPTLRTASRKL